jgi:MOSC domain-containing protein YiiM
MEISPVGKVNNIYIGESAAKPLRMVERAELVAGKGIVGDRYYNESGTFSKKLAGNPAREVTLIESEEITAFNKAFSCEFSEPEFRRNIVTVGIRLNGLVGKRFSIGGTVLKGIKLCEPCTHLQALLASDVIPGLVGKGGLRAQILAGGEITNGDAMKELQA